MNNFTISAISGAAATGPMTMVMSYLHKRLPVIERYPLPPRNITMKMADKIGVKNKISSRSKLLLTMINHFAYGAAVGALYLPLVRWAKVPRVLGGTIFGLGVWTVSYMGWLPAIGLYPRPEKIPLERNVLMIVAHMVWGISLGLIADNIEHRSLSGFKGRRSLL